MSSSDETPSRVAIVGAGLVGSLCAAMLASRGWQVDLYESRPDPRLQPASTRARSINLALSARGIEALRSVNPELAERVLAESLPMRGRMLHHKPDQHGEMRLEGQDYGVFSEGECTNSISRTHLGVLLLEHLDELPHEGRGSVALHFDTKLVDMDLRREKGVLMTVATKAEGERKEQVDLVIGSDGAYSQVRRQMMRGIRFDFKQSYARHCYLELAVPPGPDGTFSISPLHLHIWPRREFMLIALPNLDKSFTLTLFAPKETFDALQKKVDSRRTASHPVFELFKKEFPDALALMGEEALLKSWNENPKDGLITVECAPYHYQDKVLLVGDSAHAMVPFYGQGMNCGFEDIRVLSTIMDHLEASPLPLPPTPLPYSPYAHLPRPPSRDSTANRLSLALSTYTKIRTPSLAAIQKLAADNYAEMASKVLSPLYIFRLTLDSLLSRFFTAFGTVEGGGRGGSWESLYRMVTFRHGLAYEEVIRRRQWQGRVLETVGGVGLAAVVGSTVWIARSLHVGRYFSWQKSL